MAEKKLPLRFDTLEEYYQYKVDNGQGTPKGFKGTPKETKQPRKKNVQKTQNEVK